MRIDRLADDAAGNDAGQRFRHSEICGMWAAKAHRYAVTLHGANGHVRAPRRRRFHDRQRQRIGHGNNECALGLRIGNHLAEVAIDAACIRPRHDDCRRVIINRVPGFDLPAEWFSAGVHNINRLRMQLTCKQDTAALVSVMPAGNANGFSNRSRFIEKRGAGDRQAGQFCNQRLEVEQKLKTTLADFRLVRRIGGVPGRIFKQIALDDRRRMHTMIARADEALLHHVAAHDGIQLCKRIGFTERCRQIKRTVQTDRRRNRLGDEGFHGRKAERRKHCALVFQSRPDMAGNKGKNLLGHRVILPVCRNRLCRGDRKAGFHRKASA